MRHEVLFGASARTAHSVKRTFKSLPKVLKVYRTQEIDVTQTKVRSGWPDQSVLNWKARVLRTGSVQNGPAHGREPLSSSGRPKRRNSESCGRKNVRAHFRGQVRTSSFSASQNG